MRRLPLLILKGKPWESGGSVCRNRGKTKAVGARASEKVTVSVDRYFLASYDTYGAEGYI